MTRRAANTRDGLDELRVRLEGGVCRAVQDSRLAEWPARHQRTLAGWPPADAVSIVATMRDLPGEGAARVGNVVDSAVLILQDRDLLISVLLAPAEALRRIQSAMPGDAVAAWFVLCWTASAATRAVAGLPETEAAADDRDLLAPLAARLQFLVFSEPLRWRGQENRAWWASPADEEFGGGELVRRVLGDRPWHALVGEASAARRTWLGFLDSYQSHLFLARAKPSEIEEELAAVVFRHPPGGGPLAVSDRPLSEEAPLTADDLAVLSDVTERHLLPRFDLRAVIAIAGYDRRPAFRLARRVWAGLTLAVGLGAIACAAALLVSPVAVLLAAGCYSMIGIGVMLFGAAWAAQWLLRLPAAGAIGVVALVSLLPGGWLTTPPDTGAACGVLAGAAVGYLLVEARNHGVALVSALLRTLGVALAGMAHALLVSLLGLVAVAPAFIADGGHLALVWRHPGYRHAGLLLLLAACWCLAVGVFSQILWDDRPITAPLAHLSWRTGR